MAESFRNTLDLVLRKVMVKSFFLFVVVFL